MDWKEKISEGMRLIIEGCKENDSWTHCHDCPFDNYCTEIYLNGLHETPDSWK